MKLSEPVPADAADAPGAYNPLYGILAVYIPWSVLVTALPLIGGGFVHFLPALRIPYAAIFIPVILCSITAALYTGMMQRTGEDHSAADIRGGIIVTAAAYLIASLLRGRISFAGRFVPGIANIIGMAASLYVWVFVLYLREIFKARELFEAHTKRYEAENLQRIMLEDAALMSDADLHINKMVIIYGVELGIIGLLVIISSILKIKLSLPFLILIVIVYISAACIFALLNLFKREQYFAGEGIAVPAPERFRRIIAMLIFSLAAAAGAALFAADNNILPLSIITGFFSWLWSLLVRLHTPQPPTEIMVPEMPPPAAELPADFFPFMAEESAPPFPLWKILQYAGIAALAIGFIWFMIKPLLTRSAVDGKVPLRTKLGTLLRRWLHNLRQGFSFFIASLRKDDGSIKMHRPGAEALKGMAADLLAAYSPAKKREMKNSVTLFARLILWGSETLQVSWKSSRAPGEYCAALAAAVTSHAATDRAAAPEPAAAEVPEPVAAEAESTAAEAALCAAIIRSGELFEEALYSAAVLSREKQKEFKALVEQVTGA
jgi:hypothetical protein